MKGDNPKLCDFINEAYDELEDCDIVDSDGELVDPTVVIESDHSSNSEDEESDVELETEVENVRQNGSPSFLGKNGFVWSKTPPTKNVRTRAHNIIVELCG